MVDLDGITIEPAGAESHTAARRLAETLEVQVGTSVLPAPLAVLCAAACRHTLFAFALRTPVAAGQLVDSVGAKCDIP